MPRKKQIVQRKRRQKGYREGDFSGAAAKVKPRGAFRFFSNYKLFAIIGSVFLIGGLIFTALYQTTASNTNNSTSVRGSGVTRTTPVAGETPTGASTTIKQYAAPPALTIDASKTYTAVIKTSKGEIKLQLLASEAPQTVNNFVFLAREGFYDGVTFHRVIADESGQVHFAQAGDPTGTGTGGPGYELPLEASTTPVTAGIVAMAKPPEAGAPNNGSQFFITLADEPTFTGKFTVFAKVVEGMDVLARLQPRDPQAQQGLEPGERIESVTIVES